MSAGPELKNDGTRSGQKWERSLSLRITVLLVVATFLLIGQSLYNLSSIEDVDESIDIVNKAALDLDNLSRNLKTPIADIRIFSMEMVSAPNRERLDETKTRFDITVALVEKNLEDWKNSSKTSSATSQEGHEAFIAVVNSWEDYKAAVQKTYFYIDKGVRVAAFISVTGQEKESFDRLRNSLSVFSQMLVERSKEVFVSADNQSKFAIYSLSVTSVIQVLILFVTLIFVYRMFKTYMRASQAYERKIEAKEDQLRMALDNMPGGIMVIDDDLNIQLFNQHYVELYKLPNDLLQIGGSLLDMIQLRAERGDYGPGDPADLVASRLGGYGGSDQQSMENKLPSGRVLETKRNPTSEGVLVAICNDITERKKAERVIQESETKLQELLDSAPVGIGIVDQGTNKRLFVNRRLVELLGGGSAEEMTTAGLADSYVNSDDVQKLRDIVIAGGTVDNMEIHRRRMDGSTFWALQSSMALDGFQGKDTRVVWMVDISDQKQTELALQESRDTFQALADNLPQFITMKAPSGRYLFVNKTFEEWTQSDRDAVIGKGPNELYSAEQAAEFGAQDQMVINSGENNIREIEVDYPDGVTRTVIAVRFPIKSADGVVIGLGHINNDITERKEAEREVGEQKKIIETVLDTMDQGILMLDDDRNIVATNNQFTDLQGLSSDWRDRFNNFDDLILHIHKSVRGAENFEESSVKAIAEIRSNKRMTMERAVQDGGYFEIRQTPLNSGGVVRTYTDITDRKEVEAKVEEQRAQLDNILKSIHQGVVLFDRDKRLVACNAAYPEIINIEKSFFKPGLPILDITTAIAARGDYGIGDPEVLARERLDALWQSSHRSDISFGEERSFDIQSTRTADGGLVIAYTDITERKKAERIIADAMHMIHESIQYASRIQRSVLPDPKVLDDVFSDFLAIWEPKDVVGGDVYLYRKCAGGHILILIDCTGHGVPGAFMTMIATGALDQALIEIPSGDPAAILMRINQLVKVVLGQNSTEGESDDGFECGLCLIDGTEKKITYAGARFELWCVKGEEFTVVKGNKVGIGYRRTDMTYTFDNHIVPIDKGVSYYMTSDGLVDQIGGEKRRAFGKRRLKGLILDYSQMKMANQGVQILRAYEEYQHKEVRRDDISMVGFKPRL